MNELETLKLETIQRKLEEVDETLSQALRDKESLRQQLAESQALVEYLRKQIKAAEEWQAARSAPAAVVLPEASAADDPYAPIRNGVLSEVRRLNAETTTVQELARLCGCEQDAKRYGFLKGRYVTSGNRLLISGDPLTNLDAVIDKFMQTDSIQASQSQGE